MPPYRRDHQLYVQPTTCPGAELPHAWVTGGDREVSTLDLEAPGPDAREWLASALDAVLGRVARG